MQSVLKKNTNMIQRYKDIPLMMTWYHWLLLKTTCWLSDCLRSAASGVSGLGLAHPVFQTGLKHYHGGGNTGQWESSQERNITTLLCRLLAANILTFYWLGGCSGTGEWRDSADADNSLKEVLAAPVWQLPLDYSSYHVIFLEFTGDSPYSSPKKYSWQIEECF